MTSASKAFNWSFQYQYYLLFIILILMIGFHALGSPKSSSLVRRTACSSGQRSISGVGSLGNSLSIYKSKNFEAWVSIAIDSICYYFSKKFLVIIR